jgi:hypothetical protein
MARPPGRQGWKGGEVKPKKKPIKKPLKKAKKPNDD